MHQRSQFDVVLFDVGGVLVELAGLPALIEWTGARINEAAIWDWWLHSPDVRAFESGRSSETQFADAIVEKLALPISRERFLSTFAHWPIGPYPGALELLEEMAGAVTLATLSNTNTLHWPRITGEMGLGEPFAAHFPSHLTGHIKPDAAAFRNAAKALGVPAERIVFVDDNQLNVDAAISIGMHAHRVRGAAAARTLLASLQLLQ